MKNRAAFTMLELIFVIAVMGIIGKFGVEFLAQAYNSFIFSSVNNELQANSESTVEFIAKRLEGRIKNSVIARTGKTSAFTAIADVNSSITYKVFEWVSSDEDGFRGTTTPSWSGIIDLNNSASSAIILVSPRTETNTTNALINILSDGNSSINDAALYFIGADDNINGYGWDGNPIVNQFAVMHPIKAEANITKFHPRNGQTDATNSFAGVDVYEYYKLAWTANAIVMENYNINQYAGKHMGDLVMYYDYQPWNGEKFYDNGKAIKKVTIMKNVSTFEFMSIGSIIKIQVCAKSDLIEEYSLCKEKTVF
jgi:Tfp pilus assembly protein PilE